MRKMDLTVVMLVVFLVGIILGDLNTTERSFCPVQECPECPDNSLSPLPNIALTPANNTTSPQIQCSDSQNKAIVTKVIDGDTFDIQDGSRVRMLGINTPEKGQLCYKEATDRLKGLIDGEEVCLERDVTNKGKYGRLLRHVFTDSHVNLLMVREGYANVYFVSPNTKYLKEFETAEEEAKKKGGCLRNKSNYTDCIGIAFFHYNAEGNDWDNLNDEYVKFRNSCDFAISLEGWVVKDEANHIYTFPDFTLAPTKMVTLHTGCGTDDADRVFWCSHTPVWNNDGDTLYLWDKEGNLVLSYTYPDLIV